MNNNFYICQSTNVMYPMAGEPIGDCPRRFMVPPFRRGVFVIMHNMGAQHEAKP